MTDDAFIELIDPILIREGSVKDVGEEFRNPPLDVLCYYRRVVRVGRLPFFAKAQSVVIVVRQPVDTDGSRESYQHLLMRAAQAASTRYPPWKGLVVGLTMVALTPEPIGPGDDAMLRDVLATKLRRQRVVPFGILRINLGQEAIAMALSTGPGGAFNEPIQLTDALCERLRRFVPLVEM
jgi:hypothetical protein